VTGDPVDPAGVDVRGASGNDGGVGGDGDAGGDREAGVVTDAEGAAAAAAAADGLVATDTLVAAAVSDVADGAAGDATPRRAAHAAAAGTPAATDGRRWRERPRAAVRATAATPAGGMAGGEAVTGGGSGSRQQRQTDSPAMGKMKDRRGARWEGGGGWLDLAMGKRKAAVQASAQPPVCTGVTWRGGSADRLAFVGATKTTTFGGMRGFAAVLE